MIFRVRSCTDPRPNARGDYCRGDYTETVECNAQPCEPEYQYDYSTDGTILPEPGNVGKI